MQLAHWAEDRIRGLEVTKEPKVRRFLRLNGFSASRVVGLHNNSVANGLRAVRERVYGVVGPNGLEPTPKPVPGAFDCCIAFRSAVVDACDSVPHWTVPEFLATYRGQKLARYTNAARSLSCRELTRADAAIKAFVKAEALNLQAKPDPAPRIIQPRGPRYNLCVGRYLKPAEHRLYEAVARVWGGPTIMKGYNAAGTARELKAMWDQFDDPVAIGLDASRFDQHVSIAALEFEHGFYTRLFPGDKELEWLLKMQLHNNARFCGTDGSFTYDTDGCRMSGDMNTALGNCLLMCALVWAYCLSVGVTTRLANNGDDCMVFMERSSLGKFKGNLSTWFRDRGFTLTVEDPVQCFEKVSFCQCQPVMANTGYVMVRHPDMGLAKDCTWKTPDMGSPLKGFRRWAYQVGVAGSCLAGEVPVYSSAYSALQRIGLPCKRAQGFGNMESGFEYMAKGMRSSGTVTQASRESFHRAFGVLPSEQIHLENMFAALDAPTLVHPVMSGTHHAGITSLATIAVADWYHHDGE